MNFTQAEVRAQLSSHSSDYSFGWPAVSDIQVDMGGQVQHHWPQTLPGPPWFRPRMPCPPGATRLAVFHGEEEGCRRSG